MSTIQSIYNSLKQLTDFQEKIVKVIAGAQDNIEADLRSAKMDLEKNIDALVIAGDDTRYAALTLAAQNAAGTHQNFSAQVNTWNEEDRVNREDYQSLVEKYGTFADLSSQANVASAEVNRRVQALNDVAPAIEKFDKTSAQITAHNAKYPKTQITEANHDTYEKFHFGRFALWCLFLNRAPHKAYQVISAYTKEYGDYYEDLKDIGALRQTKETLLREKAKHEAEVNNVTPVLNEMRRLDRSYKGPVQIADLIKKEVTAEVKKNIDFVRALTEAIPGTCTTEIAAAALKLNAYDELSAHTSYQAETADEFYKTVKKARDHVHTAVDAVGDETISYQIYSAEEKINAAAQEAKDAARDINAASDHVSLYHPPVGTTVTAMIAHIKNLTTLNIQNNAEKPDFSGLKQQVTNSLTAYEQEQERKRQEQRRIQQELQRKRDEEARIARENEALTRAAIDVAGDILGRMATRNGGGLSGGFNDSSSGTRIGSGSNIDRGGSAQKLDKGSNISR